VAAERVRELAEAAGMPEARRRREADGAARRAARAGRTEALDLSLALCGAWFRDLGAVSEGAPELALNVDREEPLHEDAQGLDPRAPRRAVELVLETRRNLRVNVSEQLAIEALLYRAEALLS
jgi:DNA polymerase-3 subunit delta'